MKAIASVALQSVFFFFRQKKAYEVRISDWSSDVCSSDLDTHYWRARAATTLRAPVPAGPIIGFEAKDAPAGSGLAEFRSSLDESWRAGDDAISRFDLFRALPDDSRAAWLG